MAERIEAVLDRHDLGHWLESAASHGLPVSVVNGVVDALGDPIFEDAGLLEDVPLISGDVVRGIGPWLPDVGRTPRW